jgi:hypothetical protein
MINSTDMMKTATNTSEKKEKELCPICADTYTAVLRRKIVCKYCSKDACTKCIEQYLLGRIEDAHCIHCRVNYSDTVLKEICTKTYLQQTYFRHRQEILINRERASLPALQDSAKRERVSREYVQRIRKAREELNELRHRKARLIVNGNRISQIILNTRATGYPFALPEEKELEANQAEETACRLAVREKKALINTLLREQWRAGRVDRVHENPDGADGAEDGDEKDDGDEKEDRKKFIRRCMKPECQGFLSTAWKCGICEYYSCSKCFTVKGPDHDSPHTCKKEDLDTAELIRADSKPCPKCGEFINKVSGCDQMYCITCHTPWSWTTGKIVTHGVIHNPHYYEWLRRTGGNLPRNPADVPCGGYPGGWELRNLGRNTTRRSAQYLYEFHRICMELQEISERNYRSHLDQDHLNGTHIRFLLGDFNEKEWGKRLAVAEKRRKRDTEIQEVFAAFRMVAVELINRIQHYRDETVDAFALLPLHRAEEYLEKWNVEVQALIEMVNEGLKRISQAHYYQVPIIEVAHLNDRSKSIQYRIGQFKWKTETRGKRGNKESEDVENVQEQKEADRLDEETEDEVEDNETEDDETEENDRDLLIAIQRSLEAQINRT